MSNEQYYGEVYENLRGIASSEQWKLDFSAIDYKRWESAEFETVELNTKAHSEHCDGIVARQRQLADEMATHCSNNAIMFKKVMVYEHILKAAAARIQSLEKAQGEIWVEIEALRVQERQKLIYAFSSWYASRMVSSVETMSRSISALLSQTYESTSKSLTVEEFQTETHEWQVEVDTIWETLKTKLTRDADGTGPGPAANESGGEVQK